MREFIRADLSGSRFERCDLRDARFRAVTFAGAEFRGVNLSGVVMRGVELTDETLSGHTEPVEEPGWPQSRSYPVRECLLCILNEEWEHRMYAERDLDALESS